MIESFSLHHPDGATEIRVGRGALSAVAEEIGDWTAGRVLFVVSSAPIWDLHGRSLAPVEGRAARVVRLEVPDGEAAKTLAVAEQLWQRMLEAGGKRDSRVLAFGGGSVGDLAGFVAGCFLRGVEVVQVPTTLLAQVDASLGGKTAVDLPQAKNSVGVFHHPAWVVSDTEVLTTLSRRERAAGLAEVVKMALLLDPDLLHRVEDDLEALLAGDADALVPVVAGAARAKVAVVEDDPREGDRRRLLNFGHTLGHALETAAGYAGLLHGEAVNHGMRFAVRLARRRGFDAAEAERFCALLERLEPPPLPTLDRARVLAAMGRDKKAREDGLAWVLPARLGEGWITSDVPGAEVEEELARFLPD